jgi:hypothetical protein
LYVTDKGNTAELPTLGLRSNNACFDGAVVANNAVLFANSIERVADGAAFTAPGEGEMTYYIAGLYAGDWTVSYGDVKQVITVGEESGLLTFKAPAGVEISFYM